VGRVSEASGADSAGRPDPGTALTAGEFVDALVRLKRWSGLGYRQLAKRAAAGGHALPRSTLTVALNRNTLPREDLVVALATTCGCDADEVARWVAARRRIAASGPDRPGPAARLLGHLPVPAARVRRDPVEEDDDTEALELLTRDLAERQARQAAAVAATETRSVLLAGFAAAAALFLAAHDAGPVLRAAALVAYAAALGAALAAAATRPEEPASTRAGQPKAQLLAALAAARAAALEAGTTRQRRQQRCWWVAVAAFGVATALAVLAILGS